MAERVVRRAAAADREAFVALRASMFEAMTCAGWDDPAWQQAAGDWFDRHWNSAQVCIAVAQVEGVVVASAMGTLRVGVPGPGCMSGRQVLVQGVSTLRQARHRGHAQAVFDEVLRWAREDVSAEVIELHATAAGQGMYERAGFAVTAFPAMRHHIGG